MERHYIFKYCAQIFRVITTTTNIRHSANCTTAMSRPPPRRSSRLNAVQTSVEPSPPPKPTSQKRKIIILSSSDAEVSNTNAAPISKSKKPKRCNTNAMPSPFKSKKVRIQNYQPLSKGVPLKNVRQVKAVMADKCVGTEELEIDRAETNNDKEDALDLINAAFMDDMCCSLCCMFLVIYDSNNSGDLRY